MERQVPAGLSSLFEQIVQKDQEARRKSEAEREKWPLAKNLYEKARTILNEYGVEQSEKRRAKDLVLLETPPVALVNRDEGLEFAIKEDYLHEHEGFRKIEIHKRRKGDDFFLTTPLFRISLFEHNSEYGILETPLERSASPEAIQAVSELLDIMQQSLSEAHTPRSQQIKPEEPKKGLRVLFRRLKPTFGKT